jgi:hypothetical protein
MTNGGIANINFNYSPSDSDEQPATTIHPNHSNMMNQMPTYNLYDRNTIINASMRPIKPPQITPISSTNPSNPAPTNSSLNGAAFTASSFGRSTNLSVNYKSTSINSNNPNNNNNNSNASMNSQQLPPPPPSLLLNSSSMTDAVGQTASMSTFEDRRTLTNYASVRV